MVSRQHKRESDRREQKRQEHNARFKDARAYREAQHVDEGDTKQISAAKLDKYIKETETHLNTKRIKV